ncbi:MAG: Transcription elongation factor GreA [Cellvibrionales bacterium UBA7375]|nr:MAG: Transcription elongation factor GreA [Cellvibrionales bacterium UBA7375]|tara:strand:- start:143 stop:622 length:480 start_codon:yes stop_codon:yes gene_type:complete
MQKIPMTVEGEAALRIELEKLKKEDRPTVIQAIAEAREHGDLKENAEYHAAREQQGFIEGRIQDIESKLSLCQVVDISQMPEDDRVIFGSTVTIINTETDEELKYRIVGDDEADVKAGMISYQSPIARALISKEIGDVVNVHTPGGEVEYEIDDVSYSG